MKYKIMITAVLLLAVFFGWRLLRPMQIFVVSPAFERPVSTLDAPVMFTTLRAGECAGCHREFFDEWSTTIHSQAWTDPYFQVDWKFDGAAQICKNCHIPLDRQQEHRVSGFKDADKWEPLLAPNDNFDAQLQHEGVTCAGCHLRDGKILGVLASRDAPHPVAQIDDPNRICVGCHVVSGERWDTFFKFPPCGTVAEIRSAQGNTAVVGGGVLSVTEVASLGCVACHMPLVERPLVAGGAVRKTRRHLWRGGHDPEMVAKGLTVSFNKTVGAGARNYTLTITNTGATHHIPTGTPDRHLTVALQVLGERGNVLKEDMHTLKRTVMWRPFIVDLWDTRLPAGQAREYHLKLPEELRASASAVEARVDYHLLDEARRTRIGYENQTPIEYPVFRQKITIDR